MMRNNFVQRGEVGICTVASLQWAKQCLRLGRGIGNFDELSLSPHQLNAQMSIFRRFDNNPAAQTNGMGLQIVGADHDVSQIVEVQQRVNTTAPGICIFWNSHHTMGYRVATKGGRRECEWFDNEDGLWLADNDADIRQAVIAGFAARGYAPILGMRVVNL